jgi:ribosomal protein S12 methylthiotransferase accessory factor
MAVLRAGWLVGTTRDGLAIVGPDVEATVTVAEGSAVATALAAGALGDEPTGDDEHARLRALLDELGALDHAATDAPPSPSGHPLATAVAQALRDEPVDGVIWTAEEALVLPAGLTPRIRTRALRAFVAGLSPDGRLEAYALLAQGAGAIYGDVPDRTRLQRRLAETAAEDCADILVLELFEGGTEWRVAAEDLDRVGAAQAHRLGPVRRSSITAPVVPELPGLQICVAEVALANLNVVASAQDRRVQGVGDAEHARLVAHAEGAERFAGGDLSEAELVTAARAELPGAVDPRELYAGDDDGTVDVAGPRLWSPVTDRHGRRHWVPAETVHLTVPGTSLPWSSSGLAAGSDLADARHRALRELIERDAFMVAWLRRTSRERVDLRSVPEDVRGMAGVLAARGWDTTWVNLSLDTLPVILCCLTHRREGLTLGAGCHPEPSAALRRATTEALVLALRFERSDADPPEPHAVRTPRDHLTLHRDPARRADHGFLFDAPEQIDLRAIPTISEDDLDGVLDDLGSSPLIADLSSPLCHPYTVVRALAPGLVPLTFGYHSEAVAMERVQCGVVTSDGHRHGNSPHCGATADRLAHPFP